jgi:ribose transport system substrate-binding protein
MDRTTPSSLAEGLPVCRKIAPAIPLAIVAAVLALVLASTGGFAESKGKKIALSDGYGSNPWHQAMVQSWMTATVPAVQNGVVAEASAFTTKDNEVADQEAQIETLIAQHYDAIVVDAASPEALNGVVRRACDAGIVVVSFDGIVTEPCAWRINVDFRALGAAQVEYLSRKLVDGGNVLEVRGQAGTALDDAIHAGVEQGIAANPKLKLIGSVHGDWSGDVTRKAVGSVLSTLPEVKAVVTQGGEGIGVADAFDSVGRPIPLITLGNHDAELRWWKDQSDSTRYETMSIGVAPGISTLAFWVAQQILDGENVPHDLHAPFLKLEQKDLDTALANTPKGGVANTTYTQDDARQAIAAERH